MELVYLWVEDYKNIHNQGFNFSPKFKCEFKAEYEKDSNGHEQLKHNCELVLEPKEHIENFFGKNINVTAIVGENGSGKSSVLEFIRLALKKDKRIVQKYKSIILFFDEYEKTFILLNLLQNSIFIKSNYKVNNIKFQDLESAQIDNKTLQSVIFPTFDYSLTYKQLDYVRHRNQNLKLFFPVFPEKNREINLLKEEKENLKRILKNFYDIKEHKLWHIFENFFQPKKVQVYIRFGYFKQSNLNEVSKNALTELISTTKQYFENNEYIHASKNLHDMFNILSLESNYEQTNDRYRPKVPEASNFTDYLGQNLIEKNIYKEYKKDVANGDNAQVILEWDIDQLTKQEVEKIIDCFANFYYEIDIVDTQEKKFHELSFGEQQLLIVVNNLYYLGSKEYVFNGIKTEKIEHENGEIQEVDLEDNYSLNIQSLIIFFDEIELGLHPDWQVKSMQFLLKFLGMIPDRNFHLIVVSHSPFVLSDIPKENIVFLIDSKQVDVDIDTFGANIHTLLSHGFFMKDGLMGEFAKNKINDVINYLSNKESEIKDNDVAQKFINLIGEPILKRQLQKMLDSKRISRIDEIDELKRRIEVLESQK